MQEKNDFFAFAHLYGETCLKKDHEESLFDCSVKIYQGFKYSIEAYNSCFFKDSETDSDASFVHALESSLTYISSMKIKHVPLVLVNDVPITVDSF